MNYIKNNKFIFLIFGTLPFLLITGPFLPDLLICLIDIFFLFFFYNRIKDFFDKNYYLFFLFAFYFYINFNSVIGFNSIYSLKVSIPYIRFILFAFIFCYLLINIKNLRKIIFFSFFSAYLILFLFSFIEILLAQSHAGIPSHENRISSLFGDKLVMGSFVARTLPVVLGITFLENIKYKNILQISMLIICGILVFMSAERLAFVYYTVTLCSFIFFVANKKNLFLLVTLVILFFSSLFYLRPASYDRIIVSTFNQFKTADSFLFHSYRHQLHYITAFNQFKDSIFFGHGIKSFRLLCDNPKYAPIKKIENDSLRISPENGYFFLINDINSEEHAFVVGKKTNIYPLSINDVDLFYKKNIIKKKTQIYFQNGKFIEKNKPLFFEKYEFDNGCNTHPHNVHLQFLAETGLIGYSFLIISFLFVVVQMFLILKKKLLQISIDKKELYIFFCLIGLFLSIFPFFPSGNFFNNWLSSIFYFNVANLLSILSLKKK